MSKKLIFLMAFVVLLVSVAPSICNAATIFLDNYPGVVNGSTTYDPATRSTGSGSYKVYTTLANVNTALSGGDTLYIRQGTYDNPSEPSGNFNGSLQVNVSGTSGQHTIASAYDDELVVIQAKPGTSNYNPNPGDTSGVGSMNYYPHPAISVNANYVDVIGLKTYGMLTIESSHDVLLETCDLGGGGPVYNQGPVVELNFQSYDVTIRDCLIHHSCWGQHTYNGPGVMLYDSSVTVENCEFYDNWGPDIFVKDTGYQSGRTVEIRKNFFGYSSINPGNIGVLGHNQDIQIDSINVYNNIFYGKKQSIYPLLPGDNINAYNNTFVKNLGTNNGEHGDFGTHTEVLYSSHNNLHYHDVSGQNYYGVQDIGDIDYNLYYSTTGDTSWYVGRSKRADTLSGWQSYSGEDAHSVETNPLFVNASGNRPEDFKRQSYSGDVTGSSYGSVCGAYETGNETIGLLNGGSSVPGQASSPSPSNTATGVNLTANLSWTAGSGSTSSDVYFGTDSSPDSGEFQGNQTVTTFEPGTLANNTTYYWRIDEINSEGTTTGSVWSFTTVTAGTGAFQQDSGSDGIVSMEAENYDYYTQQGNHNWVSVTTPSGYTGSAAMNTTPNTGTNQNTSYATNSPQLDFEVNFVKTGTHYVWIRGYGAGDTDDSCHVGLDGSEISTCDRISTFTTSYTWSKATMDGPVATFSVASTGVQTVNVWMREDGFVFDKIVLTTNSSYTPTGSGPAESSRSGQSAPGQASSPSPANSATSVSTTADLSWTAGSGATSRDVYFGTTSPGTSQGNQTATTFDTGTMANNTTYYWRIDEINAGGTTTGTVWSFTTIGAAPGAASNPSPANSATDVSITADLSWTAGSGAISHDVYGGTDPTPDETEFLGNQTSTTFGAGTMGNDTTYSWRIDEVNANGTTTGTVWSFTTESAASPPAQASYPSPPNSATGVSITADLSWTAGSGSTSSDVYFGTSSPGASQGNQTATTFDTGTMFNNTTYYWRIDEINAAGTTTGTVWSFTTIVAAPGAASNPSPSNSATDIVITVDLSWTEGSGSTSSDVYFGTTSPGTLQGNQTATTFDPGTLSNSTTYYWRIDEVNAGGTTTGTVWTFTTTATGGYVTEEFGDATNTDYSGTVEDTYTNVGASSTNFSSDTVLNTYTWPADTIANTTIIKWDLTDISTSATVTQATLYLYQTNSRGDTAYDIGVHKITGVDPTITSCTWNTYDGTNSWTGGSNGGLNDIASAEDTPAVSLTNDEYKSWDVTDMVADWVATPANNYGMMVISDESATIDSFRTFASSDATNASTRPKLIVTYSSSASAPDPASSPSPANTATGVSITADLSWTPGSGSTSSNVYFGTDSTPDAGEFQGNQTAITYDPGTMSNDTTYYWRIDEVNAQGTTTGTVWSFTTEAESTPTTEEFGDATNTDYPGTVDDTYNNVGSGGDDNWSTDTTLNTYTWPADTVANTTIIKWDLTDISTSANVTEATLYLYQTESSGDSSYDIGVHKITGVDPTITSCTWNTYNGTNNWTGGTDGGQSDIAAAEDTKGVNLTDDQYKTWDVTDMVADWVATPASNYGMMVKDDGSASVDSYRFFASSDATNASTRPKLIVTYTPGTAPPGQATNPSPANTATNVSVNTDLSWTAGSGSTSSNVYFGTSSPGASQGNQTATTFDTGTMANDTTYYWRIDEVNTNGTTTGNVWSFTTVAASSDVEIIGSWTSGTSHTKESGTNRALIFIAHGESSADTSDLGSVTYGGQSMTKVVERNMHYSYSAYTCAFILDEDGIDAATSSTFVVTWDTAPSDSSAFTSVFLQNVNQTTLVGATGTGGTTTTTAETSALSTNDGDMAIVAGTCGNSATYSTINSFTEAIEVEPSSADGIGGYLECTGANVTPGVSHTNVNRQSVIGFVVQAE
ncbi:MAG: DNRLRE domain-containing protein [Planctomycetota bacterium]